MFGRIEGRHDSADGRGPCPLLGMLLELFLRSFERGGERVLDSFVDVTVVHHHLRWEDAMLIFLE